MPRSTRQGSLSSIASPRDVLEVTGIDKGAYERLLSKKSGTIEFSPFFNDDTVSDAEHSALKTLPTTNVLATYTRGTTLGNPAAVCLGKQVNYDWARGEDGSLTGTVQVLSDGYGLEWGRLRSPAPASPRRSRALRTTPPSPT